MNQPADPEGVDGVFGRDQKRCMNPDAVFGGGQLTHLSALVSMPSKAAAISEEMIVLTTERIGEIRCKGRFPGLSPALPEP